jgi:hypothetical protein
MKELWLKFKDPYAGEKRVQVDKARLVVGRHSESDLCIADGRLSREHVRIERFGDKFVITDLGSSNGSTINGDPLGDMTEIKDGDEIVLGGGVQIRAEISSDLDLGAEPETPAAENSDLNAPAAETGVAAPSHSTSAAASAPQGSSVPRSLFIIAPILGLVVLVMLGGLVYLLAAKKQPVVASNDEFQYSKEDDDDEDDPPVNKRETKSDDNTNKSSSSDSTTTTDATPTNSSNSADQPPPASLSDMAKIEQSGAAFLRRVAQNDPKAFLTTDQAKRVSSKIKQFSGSSALADNIKSAGKNAAQIRSLATEKNLKPQLLAVAALAKLGNSRGDVLQTAKGLADVLDKLGTQIGSESGEDALLMVAVYDQGAAGDFLKMRNMLQDLANKFPESARSIRSIWFLEKNGKITSSEFDAALTFLAIGTITQNPKDFGVNAETLSL